VQLILVQYAMMVARLPDLDGCSVSTPACSVAKHGYCDGDGCAEGGGIAGDYPACGTYSQCND